MLAFFKTRRGARIAVFTLAFAVAGIGPIGAAAKSKAKQIVNAVEPSDSMASPAGSPAPVRFFTINQVLSKQDGRLRGSDAVRLAAIKPSVTMTDVSAPVPSPNQAAVSDQPFGMLAFRAPEGLLWVKWRTVEVSMRAEAKTLERCRADSESCPPAAARFLALVDAARGQQDRARLDTVNRGINANIKYVSDMAQHGVPDLWSTPLASFASGRGDCEDYVIAKYVALRETGVAAGDLRLLLVHDTLSRQDHAVLAVRHDGRWLVLDNRWDAMTETGELPRFRPLFAIDDQGVKLFAAPYAALRGTPDDDAGPTSRDPAFSEWKLRGGIDAIAPAAAPDDGAVIAP